MQWILSAVVIVIFFYWWKYKRKNKSQIIKDLYSAQDTIYKIYENEMPKLISAADAVYNTQRVLNKYGNKISQQKGKKYKFVAKELKEDLKETTELKDKFQRAYYRNIHDEDKLLELLNDWRIYILQKVTRRGLINELEMTPRSLSENNTWNLELEEIERRIDKKLTDS